MRTLLFVLSFCLCKFSHAQATWIQTGIRDTVLGLSGDGTHIWIATEHDGIKSFNPSTGETNTYDSTNSEIETADFRSIECAFGKIYAGSYSDGLYVFDGSNWTNFDTSNSDIPGNIIRDIVVEPTDSSIWLATNKGLARYFQSNTWIVYDSIADQIQATHINCLHRSVDGTLWIGTRYNGITKFVAGAADNYNFLNSGINDNWTRAITEDAFGTLYVSNNAGINTYKIALDDWLFVYTLYTAPLTSVLVNGMAFDSDDTFWIISHDGTVRADSANNWTQFYTQQSDISHNTADALYIDASNRVYVGTYGGLCYYDAPDPPRISDTIIMQVYPNPATQTLHVITMQSYAYPPTFHIFDVQGREVTQFTTSYVVDGECTYQLDLTHLVSGMYLLQAITSSQHQTWPFIKAR